MNELLHDAGLHAAATRGVFDPQDRGDARVDAKAVVEPSDDPHRTCLALRAG